MLRYINIAAGENELDNQEMNGESDEAGISRPLPSVSHPDLPNFNTNYPLRGVFNAGIFYFFGVIDVDVNRLGMVRSSMRYVLDSTIANIRARSEELHTAFNSPSNVLDFAFKQPVKFASCFNVPLSFWEFERATAYYESLQKSRPM